MHRSFLKYHGQHLSSPRYHRHQAKYHYSNYLTNKVYIYICIYGHFTFLFEHVCPRTLATESYYLLANNFSPPLQERRIDPRDSRRASISHGTSPSRGVSNLRSDEPQAAAASSRSGTIKSTAVPWVYGKCGCVGEFRAWRNRGRRQSAIP